MKNKPWDKWDSIRSEFKEMKNKNKRLKLITIIFVIITLIALFTSVSNYYSINSLYATLEKQRLEHGHAEITNTGINEYTQIIYADVTNTGICDIWNITLSAKGNVPKEGGYGSKYESFGTRSTQLKVGETVRIEWNDVNISRIISDEFYVNIKSIKLSDL